LRGIVAAHARAHDGSEAELPGTRLGARGPREPSREPAPPRAGPTTVSRDCGRTDSPAPRHHGTPAQWLDAPTHAPRAGPPEPGAPDVGDADSIAASGARDVRRRPANRDHRAASPLVPAIGAGVQDDSSGGRALAGRVRRDPQPLVSQLP